MKVPESIAESVEQLAESIHNAGYGKTSKPYDVASDLFERADKYELRSAFPDMMPNRALLYRAIGWWLTLGEISSISEIINKCASECRRDCRGRTD